ncbi:hypothetical protein Goklo_020377 [Gossypium klotzschianum]|uniref:RNase H type-1 domain-containing protein n=1 Tax=Gossypium klotzschianum TaxID=34286 RepID=A0A7J8URN0_9ROSI|nr:hypothetical protein [Gossypium klotzschianum]
MGVVQNLLAQLWRGLSLWGVKGVVNQWACKTMIVGRWHLPETDWVKVNVDGSVSRSNSKVSVGGAMRGPTGGWLVGFKMVIGRYMIDAPKLGKSEFRHIQRNVNKVVDCITKTDRGEIDQLIILKDPPHNVRGWPERKY